MRDVGAHELVNDLNGEGQKGDEGQDPARIGEGLERCEGEAENPFPRPPQVLAEVVRRLAEHALGTVVIDARLLEADPGAKATDELIGLGKGDELLHDLAVE